MGTKTASAAPPTLDRKVPASRYTVTPRGRRVAAVVAPFVGFALIGALFGVMVWATAMRDQWAGWSW